MTTTELQTPAKKAQVIGTVTLSALASRIGQHTFNTWFSGARVTAFDGLTVYISVNDRSSKDWIQRWFIEDILFCAKVEFGYGAERVRVEWRKQLCTQIFITRRPGLPFAVDPRMPTISDVMDLVSSYYSVPVTDITSSRRDRSTLKARHVCMYLARHITLRSLPEIGRKMGGRDHTTVINGVERITKLIDEDNAMAADIAYLSSHLAANMNCIDNGE